MRALMSVLAIGTILFAAAPALHADDRRPPPFLKTGSDYVLRFAGESPFKQTEGFQVPRNDGKDPKKARITMTSASVTYSVSVFTVVEFSGDSWVLVEHPKSIKDAFKWNFKRIAMAALTPETIAKLKASEDGNIRLERLQRQASVEIEADKTWVNINHVIAIAELPTEPQDFKLNMNMSVNAKD